MGNTRSGKSQTFRFLEQTGNLIVNNNSWVEVCSKFEVGFYKKGNEDSSTVKWDEFNEIFFKEYDIFKFDIEALSNRRKGLAPNLIKSKVNFDQVMAYYAMREIFESNYFEMRIYRVYILFLVNSVDENSAATKLNFIELLFEKVIYNLELEARSSEVMAVETHPDNDLDETKEEVMIFTEINITEIEEENERQRGSSLKKKRNNKSIAEKSGMISVMDVSDNRLIKEEKNLDEENYIMEDSEMSESFHLDNSSIDDKLVKIFQKFRQSKIGKAKTYVKKITISMFKLILYMFFETSIVNVLYGYKKVLEKIALKTIKLEDVYWNNELKGFIKRNFNYDKIIDLNQFNHKVFTVFINQKMEKFVETRDNLARQIHEKNEYMRINNKVEDEEKIKFKYDWMIINFDDIYAFLNKNDYFFHSHSLYKKYLEFLNVS